MYINFWCWVSIYGSDSKKERVNNKILNSQTSSYHNYHHFWVGLKFWYSFFSWHNAQNFELVATRTRAHENRKPFLFFARWHILWQLTVLTTITYMLPLSIQKNVRSKWHKLGIMNVTWQIDWWIHLSYQLESVGRPQHIVA